MRLSASLYQQTQMITVKNPAGQAALRGFCKPGIGVFLLDMKAAALV
jgi:hypothetical protein